MILLLLACAPKRPQPPPPPPPEPQHAQAKLPVLDFTLPADRPTLAGSPDAPNTLVLFTDYECPYCQQAHRELEPFTGREDLRIVVLNFPLNADCNAALNTQMHPNACSSAVAAECAHQQSRFPEVAERLSQPGADLSAAGTLAVAQALELDPVAYERCVDDPATLAQVQADAALGMSMGIRGTPSFILQRADGVWVGLEGLHQLPTLLP